MIHTWGHLVDTAPFRSVFPDGRVPLKGVFPIIPREAGAPPCYLVDVGELSSEQVEQLAALLWELWRPECESVDQAIRYIHDEGLPLQVDHFASVATTRMGLVDLPGGDHEDHGDWDDGDDWDHDDREEEDELDYWLGNCGWVRGQGCTLAGTEECDFECPFRADNYKGLRLTQARLTKRKGEQ